MIANLEQMAQAAKLIGTPTRPADSAFPQAWQRLDEALQELRDAVADVRSLR